MNEFANKDRIDLQFGPFTNLHADRARSNNIEIRNRFARTEAQRLVTEAIRECFFYYDYQGGTSSETVPNTDQLHKLIEVLINLINNLQAVTHNVPMSQNFHKFLHDVRTPLASVQGYAELIIRYQIRGDEYMQMLAVIQSSLQLAASINSAFDMKNDVMLNRPYPLGKSMNLVRDLAVVYREPLDDPEGESDIKLHIKITYEKALLNDEFAYEVSHFNPVMIERLIMNFIQNAFKAYRSLALNSEEKNTQGNLAIHIFLRDGHIVMQVDDEATGFPEKKVVEMSLADSVRHVMVGDEASEVIISKLDGMELIPHEVHQGEFGWGENIRGTGVGLSSLVADVASFGGEMKMGSKIQNGRKKGARTEVYFPFKQS